MSKSSRFRNREGPQGGQGANQFMAHLAPSSQEKNLHVRFSPGRPPLQGPGCPGDSGGKGLPSKGPEHRAKRPAPLALATRSKIGLFSGARRWQWAARSSIWRSFHPLKFLPQKPPHPLQGGPQVAITPRPVCPRAGDSQGRDGGRSGCGPQGPPGQYRTTSRGRPWPSPSPSSTGRPEADVGRTVKKHGVAASDTLN